MGVLDSSEEAKRRPREGVAAASSSESLGNMLERGVSVRDEAGGEVLFGGGNLNCCGWDWAGRKGGFCFAIDGTWEKLQVCVIHEKGVGSYGKKGG